MSRPLGMPPIDERDGVEEEIRKERVKMILPLELHLRPKAELVLVALGFKPAAAVRLWRKHNSPPKVFEKALHAVGFAFVEKEQEDGNGSFYAVAQTQQNAERLGVLIETMHSKEKTPAYHAEFGKLMGYPQSAIDGVLNKRTVRKEEISEDPDIVMGEFVLSLEHWQEEREFQRQWNQAIKQYAPDLYAELQEQRATAKTHTAFLKGSE